MQFTISRDSESSVYCKVRNRWWKNQGIIRLRWSSFKEGETHYPLIYFGTREKGTIRWCNSYLWSSAHEISECNQILLFIWQTWAQDTFKISSSRPSSYFYIQYKNQVLCSLKNTSSSKNLLFQESSSKNFMCQPSSSKQNENPAIQALSKKPKIFQVLILVAGWI